jgi:methylated-DNA-[protein]-cysteine S-methyltransferase
MATHQELEISRTKLLFYTIFRTEFGWMGVLGGEKGLIRITLPQKTETDVYIKLGNLDSASFHESNFYGLIERFKAYYSGTEIDFSDKLDFSGATPFQRLVWETTKKIPYGKTCAYAWVANQIGKPKAARVVGRALGANPFPVIVPCHRVIASNGTLHGFGGGLEMKAKLLALESSSIRILRPALV